MAKLRHVTSYFSKENILKNGLTFITNRNEILIAKDNLFSDIKFPYQNQNANINWLLDVYKFPTFPDYMSATRCIYSTIYTDLLKPGNTDPHAFYNPQAFAFTFESKELDQSKLFINDPTKDNHFKRMVSVYKKMISDGITKKLQDKYRFLAWEFWLNMIPFNDYFSNPEKYPTPKNIDGIYEVLYFGEIPPKLLTAINVHENKDNDKLVQQYLKEITPNMKAEMSEENKEFYKTLKST